jgi:hypothetical protein
MSDVSKKESPYMRCPQSQLKAETLAGAELQ